jgi:hypothetical protein
MKATDADDPWRIRQSGIYHRLDIATGHSLLVVMSPVPQSAFECTLRKALNSPDTRPQLVANPMPIHQMLILEHIKSMRGYLKHIDEGLEGIVRIVFTRSSTLMG